MEPVLNMLSRLACVSVAFMAAMVAGLLIWQGEWLEPLVLMLTSLLCFTAASPAFERWHERTIRKPGGK